MGAALVSAYAVIDHNPLWLVVAVTILAATALTRLVVTFDGRTLTVRTGLPVNLASVPFREDADVSAPISPYAASKRAMELACFSHHHLHRVPIACLRFFTVFGPRQRPDLAISLFLNRISRGESIPFFGDGSSSRDYTYVDDIVAGVVAAHDRIASLGGCRTWNLGGNKPHSLDEMVRTIESVVGKSANLDRKPMQAGDVERTFADLTRSTADLGYLPRTTLAEGIRKQWEWMKSR